MLVVNKGHGSVIVEYNRTRYMFSNDGKPVEIPVEALINAYKSGHIHSHDLIPCEINGSELLKENNLLKKENSGLKDKIEELEKKLKRIKK